MCLAVPALVKTIDGAQALVELGGVERRVSLSLTPDARVGDYVLIHTGFAIGVVDEQEAQTTLELLRELAEHYEPDDLFYHTGDEPAAPEPDDDHLAPGLAADLRPLVNC